MLKGLDIGYWSINEKEAVMKCKLKIIIFLTIILAIAGCSATRTYTGEPKARENIAILKGSWNIYFLSQVFANVGSVDGKDINSSSEVEVLPGEHEVSAYLGIMYSYGGQAVGELQSFKIKVEAGHVYVIDGDWNDGKNLIWIEDENTGKIIAGNKPN